MSGRFSDRGQPDATAAGIKRPPEAPPVLIVDSNQRCVEVNDGALRLLGMSRTEIVGRSVESLDLPVGHLSVLARLEEEDPADASSAGATADLGGGRARRPSPREREILTHLARGSTDVQIAEALDLSPATVQTHVRNAKSKLGASTRAQAVALALVSGLIDLDPRS